MNNPPIFPCVGGKGRLRRWLLGLTGSLLVDRYVEPFAGNANVFLLAASRVRAARWWLNDLTTVPFLKVLYDGLGKHHLPERPWDTPGTVWRERAHFGCPTALAIAPFVTWGAKGHGYSMGAKVRRNYCPRTLERKFSAAKEIMWGTRPLLTGEDYRSVLEELGPEDFVYLDPPYEGCCGTPYPAICHEELLALLPSLHCRWLLSGYESDLYLGALGAPAARRRLHMALGHSREYRMECVWANFPLQRGLEVDKMALNRKG
jgi:hypothetical protein